VRGLRPDQAHGLRRLFAGVGVAVLPVLANPHLSGSGRVLDLLAAALVAQGRRVVIVDAADTSPPPGELARLDLSACIEPLAPGVGYLAARGLPLAWVDTRGSAAAFVDALLLATPATDAVLLHADAAVLARVLPRRVARPLLLAADRAESLMHAYAGAKWLAQRGGWLTFDLVLGGRMAPARRARLETCLAGCIDRFLGGLLLGRAAVDPAAAGIDAETRRVLHELVATQLALAAADGTLPAGVASGAAADADFIAGAKVPDRFLSSRQPFPPGTGAAPVTAHRAATAQR
jgi:flagellar biosynthesis protein FlhG